MGLGGKGWFEKNSNFVMLYCLLGGKWWFENNSNFVMLYCLLCTKKGNSSIFEPIIHDCHVHINRINLNTYIFRFMFLFLRPLWQFIPFWNFGFTPKRIFWVKLAATLQYLWETQGFYKYNFIPLSWPQSDTYLCFIAIFC